VEFIGCGYSQMIGPLVPWKVTEANLRIGNDIYQRLLGILPRLALVNEQAYSGGLVGLYLDAGYDGLIMDWDNPASTHDWPAETGYRAQRALGADGRSIALIWSNTVAFQKLQRYAHGDIALDDYLTYVRSQRGAASRSLCLYASDAEIFDFRPGRYKTEEKIGDVSEWSKLEDALSRLQGEPGCAIVRLCDVLQETTSEPLRLETAAVPIPVKKQRKYNLSRWAVTGRDDLFLNAACEKLYRALDTANADPAAWKELCWLWASDFRTHITAKRWAGLKQRLDAALRRFPLAEVAPPPAPQGPAIEDRMIDIRTPGVAARLDRRRGLALSSASFGGGAAADRHAAARHLRRHRAASRLVYRQCRVRGARRAQGHRSRMGEGADLDREWRYTDIWPHRNTQRSDRKDYALLRASAPHRFRHRLPLAGLGQRLAQAWPYQPAAGRVRLG
jgi:hypothetical protein